VQRAAEGQLQRQLRGELQVPGQAGVELARVAGEIDAGAEMKARPHREVEKGIAVSGGGTPEATRN
jgi:hypothetical protein